MHEIATDRWGQGATIDWFLPSRASSTRTRQALARFERMAISPSAFLRMLRMISEIDVRAALPAIRVPTLVIQRLGDRINPPFYGRYIATHIPGARYFEQPGDHVLRFAQDEESADLFAEIEDFLATTPPSTEPARVLTTILLAERVRDFATSKHVRSHRGRCAQAPLKASSPPSTRPAKRSAAQQQSVPMPQLTASSHESGSTPAKSAS